MPSHPAVRHGSRTVATEDSHRYASRSRGRQLVRSVTGFTLVAISLVVLTGDLLSTSRSSAVSQLLAQDAAPSVKEKASPSASATAGTSAASAKPAASTTSAPATSKANATAKPGDVKPGDVKPGDVKPGDVKPGDVKPGDVKPGDVKPGDVKPDAASIIVPTDAIRECRWAYNPITIDGKADEKDWEHAEVVENFGMAWLTGKKARSARTGTRARLLWDRQHLYFFADMDDADLYADVTQHDGQTWDNDVFELFFKPAADQPGYYEFQVNAANTQMDMFVPRRGSGGYARYKSDGKFHLQTAVQLRGTLNNWTDKDTGWSVEGRIPWSDFHRTGGGPKANDIWKFTLCRYDYSVDFEGPELSSCAPLTHPNFHRHEDYAPLKFLGPKTAGTPLETGKRIPWTTSKVIGSPEPPPPYTVERVFPDLVVSKPIGVVHQPGSDRIWLLHISNDKTRGSLGRIIRIKDDPAVKEFETLIQIEKGTAYGVVFHPRFQENGYVFVGHDGPVDGKKSTCVTRYKMNPKAPYELDEKSAQVIIHWESNGHNGGDVCFGHDGMLYVTSGDGTSDSDTNLRGQDLTQLTAKVLRIDVDHPAPNQQYSVPQDNPFLHIPNARPETWAYGLRNPWRMTVDKKTGHIWVGNNGQDVWEQVFLVKKGDNYGWSVMEGGHPFYLERQKGPTPFVPPVVDHNHSEARSLTGGVVYYGQRYPELQGCYIYGDYSTGKIWALRHDGTKILAHKEIADTSLQIVGFGTDTRGELLIADHATGYYKLVPSPPRAPTAPFPKKLSETGIFTSVAGHQLHPGLVPYSVNAPLWSDGTHKERFIGIPSKGQDQLRIDFTANRGWKFPNDSVLVKSFALDMVEGDPSSRKWIETRILTRQNDEWAGYSYLWNDDQTDAVLVETRGQDKDFVVRTAKSPSHPDGLRKQTWRYPSRTECMVCHARAAQWVLGLTELQMNRLHNYGGVVDHQFRVLETLGLLKMSWSPQTIEILEEQFKAAGKSESEVADYVSKLPTPRKPAPAATKIPPKPAEPARRLVDPYDPQQDLNARARSYLHANCAICHVEAGGGNSQFEIEFATKPERIKLFDVKPEHHIFNMKDARLVAPGAPERSVLLHRVSIRGRGQMPPLASSLVDQPAVEMLREWITKLPPEPKPEAKPEPKPEAKVETKP